MISYYVKTDTQTISSLRDGSDDLEETLDRLLAAEESTFDLDKAWAGIHYLLCGSVDLGEGPLHEVLLGGHPLGTEDFGVGPARYLEASEVATCLRALEEVEFSTYQGRFDAEVVGNPDIYPGYDGEDGFNYLEYGFQGLLGFLRQAVAEACPVILCIA